MPHYKDGSVAHVGDRLHFAAREYDPDTRTYRETVREGSVFSINPGAGTCNAQVAYAVVEVTPSSTSDPADRIAVVRLNTRFVTLAECVRVGCDPEPAEPAAEQKV